MDERRSNNEEKKNSGERGENVIQMEVRNCERAVVKKQRGETE